MYGKSVNRWQQAVPYLKIFPHFLVMILLTIWASDHIFFWDTISQGSRLVDFYYQTNFSHLFLPTEIDQGHPPLFQIYIALGWKIFGRTLFVSHLLMVPILLGIVWQLYLIIKYFFSEEYHWIALTLPFFDTTFLAQSILVSPDVLLLFAFLLSLNGVLKNRNWMIVLGTILLGLTSIRGIVMVGILFLISLSFERGLLNFRNLGKFISVGLKKIQPFISAIILVSGYLIFHYIETGWWISTPSESWNTQRGMVGITQVLKNVGIAGWRLLDFGKFGAWIIIGIYILKILLGFINRDREKSKNIQKRTVRKDKKTTLLLIILFTFLTVNIGLFMWFSNPLAHRYFLPAYIIQILLVGYLLLELQIFKRASKITLVIVLSFMFSGNFWVYPDEIAQGWDSTMAHVPYYELRDEMLEFMEQNNIPIEKTISWFPNKSNLDELDLSNREFGMNAAENEHEYTFYSNVMNDIPPNILTYMKLHIKPIKQFEKRGVKVVLIDPQLKK